MWEIIPSLRSLVDVLAPAFTVPSFTTHTRFLIAWFLCLGSRNLRRVGQADHPDTLPDNNHRHGLDCVYNFFARSAWSPVSLAYWVSVLILTRLTGSGRSSLLVDDTLAHKRGSHVWGIGWWRDAVASTRKRVATASGHNWVVLAIAYTPPWADAPVLALPLLARLRLPGKGQPSCANLARMMLDEVLRWWPARNFTLVGDGAYACKELLADLDPRVEFVGRMRGDAAVYDPRVPEDRPHQRGPKPTKGPRLPSPREAARKANGKRVDRGPWLWQPVSLRLYGQDRRLLMLRYEAVWSHVFGLRRIAIVVVSDPSGRLDDVYLFTTDLASTGAEVIEQFGRRWSIEVLFKASKQVLEMEGPQHWCQESVEKVTPWVWSMQSVVMVWYLTAGRELPEALELRSRLGSWDSEWSLRFMGKVLRSATMNATIQPNSASPEERVKMIETLKNMAILAA